MKATLLASIVVVGGCITAPARVAPQPCPAEGIAAASVRPLNDQPTPTTSFRPPLPLPSRVRGQRASIRVVVDTAGRVMPDSITICGLSDVQYANRLAQVVATVRFAPARPDVPVAGPTQIGVVVR